MDGGSGLNIMYAETLDAMRISWTQLCPSRAPLHGIILGKRNLPLGQIDLSVTFGDPSNFRKETLTFEVVGFRNTYHAVLGWPRYAKFMAIPNYTYLKLKMPGPNGVIIVHTTYQHAYECDVECCEYAKPSLSPRCLQPSWKRASKRHPTPSGPPAPSNPPRGLRKFPSTPAALTARRGAGSGVQR
jgi:hypothetical protein